MRAFRIVFQLIFGLLSAAIIFHFLITPNADYASGLTLLTLFVLVILVLGPWWPSPENILRWGENSKLRLPTDDPQVLNYVSSYIFAVWGFYEAWHMYSEPTKELWGLERTVYAIAGVNGVIAFWLLLAFAVLINGIKAHRKVKKS